MNRDAVSWTAAGFDYRIECSAAALSAIDMDVRAAYENDRREIGGVLFGSVADGIVRITAFQAVPCGYEAGNLYTFSEAGEAALAQVLEAARSDADLRGLEPLGFYRSHIRNGPLQLFEGDAAVFGRYFDQPWQIIVLLRPRDGAPTRAGWFYREAGGALRTEPYGEFDIAIDAAEPARALRPRRGRALVWFAAGVLVALPLALSRWSPFAFSDRGIALRVSESAGQLRIEWDRQARPVREAEHGYLEILDGIQKLRVDVDRSQLQNGSVVYWRASANALVRMVLERKGGPPVEEMARFVGPPPTNIASAEPPPLTLDELSLPGGEAAREIAPEPVAPSPEPPKERPVETMVVEVHTPPPPRQFRMPEAPKRAATPAPTALDAPPLVAQLRPQSGPLLPVAPAVPQPPPVVKPRPAAPVRVSPGQVIWTGSLPKRAVLQIEGGRVSSGQLSGALPDLPAVVHVLPGEMTSGGLRLYTNIAKLHDRFENASASNGWNDTEYIWDPVRVSEIAVLETPGQQNGWKRLVLRSENRTYSVIVFRWEPPRQ